MSSRTPCPIVLLSQSLDLGGSERQLAEVAMALDRRRFRPAVACFDGRGVRADELRYAGVPVIEFPVQSFVSPGTAAIAWRFCAWLRRERISLAHPFDVPTVIFAVPLGRVARVPVVLSSQRGDRRLFARGAQRALGIADRLADGIIVNSDYVRRVLVTEFGAKNGRVWTYRNGLDVSLFQRNLDAECRRHLAAAAVRTIQDQYTIQASARRYAALYEEMLERTATPR